MKITTYKMGVVVLHSAFTLMGLVLIPLRILWSAVRAVPIITMMLITAALLNDVTLFQLIEALIITIIAFYVFHLPERRFIRRYRRVSKATQHLLLRFFIGKKNWNDACIWWCGEHLMTQQHYAYDIDKHEFIRLEVMDESCFQEFFRRTMRC